MTARLPVVKGLAAMANEYISPVEARRKDETIWRHNGCCKIFQTAIPNKIRDLLGMVCDVNLETENSRNYIEIKVKKRPLA